MLDTLDVGHIYNIHVNRAMPLVSDQQHNTISLKQGQLEHVHTFCRAALAFLSGLSDVSALLAFSSSENFPCAWKDKDLLHASWVTPSNCDSADQLQSTPINALLSG